MRRLRLFLLLSPAERRLTIEALLLPIAVSLGFRLVGVPRSQGWLRRWALASKAHGEPAEASVNIRMARRAQTRVLRLTGIGGTCLVRSLALWAMLLRRGIEVNLRVGFRRHEGKIEGHAWVEYGDAPINEAESKIRTYTIYEQPVRFDLFRPV